MNITWMAGLALVLAGVSWTDAMGQPRPRPVQPPGLENPIRLPGRTRAPTRPPQARVGLIPPILAQLDPESFTHTQCKNAVTTVTWCRDPERRDCQPPARHPCYPWGCNQEGTACEQACLHNGMCASGAGCDQVTGQCAPALQVCKDAHTAVTGTGTEFSCAPYKCEAGACARRCDAHTDCVDSHVCVGGYCNQRCASDASCGQGRVCLEPGVCAPARDSIKTCSGFLWWESCRELTPGTLN